MVLKKPDWLTTKVDLTSFDELISLINNYRLHVVCYEASCPNIGTCFHKKTATFLILGDICTRNCKFCGISKGLPADPDPNEPINVVNLVKVLNLKHVVITSVCRDDLADLGVSQFIKTIRELRKGVPKVKIEVLIPDFQGKKELLDQLIQEKPDIINHNMETVSNLYLTIRPQADYTQSLAVLNYIKYRDPSIYTKSGFMVGLGESETEIKDLIRDLRENACDILTIGQYLRPSEAQVSVKKYYTPGEFQKYAKFGQDLGFLSVSAAPLVRSSLNAESFSQKFLK